MDSTITEHYLMKVYEDLHREQLTLMNSMKSLQVGDTPKGKEADTTKQITYINSIMLGLVRLKNLRKSIALKGNM